MANFTYKVYKEKIKEIVENPNTLAVFLVGSSKNIDFDSSNEQINDIDVFVFVEQGENQERILSKEEGIDFDINYFSKFGVRKLLLDKEYFFIKEMKDAKVLFDKADIANNIKEVSSDIYLRGPEKISLEEKSFLKLDIESKISRLKHRENFDGFEYHFLTNLYLKDIIIGYFNIEDKWVPKDKKLLKVLKEEDNEL